MGVWLISWRKRISKSFFRCRTIWQLTIGFFCKLLERKRSSEERGTGGRCGLWYPFSRRLLDLTGGAGQGGVKAGGGVQGDRAGCAG